MFPFKTSSICPYYLSQLKVINVSCFAHGEDFKNELSRCSVITAKHRFIFVCFLLIRRSKEQSRSDHATWDHVTGHSSGLVTFRHEAVISPSSSVLPVAGNGFRRPVPEQLSLNPGLTLPFSQEPEKGGPVLSPKAVPPELDMPLWLQLAFYLHLFSRTFFSLSGSPEKNVTKDKNCCCFPSLAHSVETVTWIWSLVSFQCQLFYLTCFMIPIFCQRQLYLLSCLIRTVFRSFTCLFGPCPSAS